MRTLQPDRLRPNHTGHMLWGDMPPAQSFTSCNLVFMGMFMRGLDQAAPPSRSSMCAGVQVRGAFMLGSGHLPYAPPKCIARIGKRYGTHG